MLGLHSERKVRSQSRRPARWIAALFLLMLLFLVAERWRGQRMLRLWKQRTAAQGYLSEVQRLWPSAPVRHPEFSNRLAHALEQLPPELHRYNGQLQGLILTQGNIARRGSQEPQPPTREALDLPLNWTELAELVDEGRLAFQSVREVMKDPPGSTGCDLNRILEAAEYPSFVSVRVGAQTLQTSVLINLHRGDLDQALDDLVALLAFARLYAQEPTLVSVMVRVAVIGLSVEPCWDALQSPGWTDEQLSKLASACQDVDLVLSQMQRALDFEAAGRVYEWNRLRQHSYEQWMRRYQKLFESYGMPLPVADAAARTRLFRQWIFHPVWAFAWADQEELIYRQFAQKETAAIRRADRSWVRLQGAFTHLSQSYRPPPLAWRFYLRLPIVESLSDSLGGEATSAGSYPYADFSRAWFVAMKNLTLHELVRTSIALRRYGLRYGRGAPELGALVPEFLPRKPMDLMDGRPLRYRLHKGGSILLYSVGENGRDDKGDYRRADEDNGGRCWPCEAPDWVWPRSPPVQAKW